MCQMAVNVPEAVLFDTKGNNCTIENRELV